MSINNAFIVRCKNRIPRYLTLSAKVSNLFPKYFFYKMKDKNLKIANHEIIFPSKDACSSYSSLHAFSQFEGLSVEKLTDKNRLFFSL